MKVFVSSARRGLEPERDALPGLIRALGHESVRFEDFTAQSVPSREACIKGVEVSDAYLLLLGPYYGQVFPGTQQSVTHDEWVTARRLGLPRYVFRKTGIDVASEQQQFERELGDDGSGRRYRTFTDATDLQAEVASALRELETTPQTLDYEPLLGPADIQWMSTGGQVGGHRLAERPLLEVHVLPLGGRPLSRRLLEQAETALPARVRGAGLVGPTKTLQAVHGIDRIELPVPDPENRRSLRGTLAGSLAGVRVRRDGQIAVTFRLPGDGVGFVLDVHDTAERIASALRLAGQLDLTGAERIAVGAGLTTRARVTVGSAGQGPRLHAATSADAGAVHLDPDEIMGRAALDEAADEVAGLFARSLVREFEQNYL